MHFGEITFGVDERGEVGLLSAQHQDPGLGRCGEDLFRRPHHGDGRIENVCLRRRAQSHGPEHASRPLPDPLAHRWGRARANISRNSSIHNTYSRCVTVHGTNNLRIENNVTYNTVGHCYFPRRRGRNRKPVHSQSRHDDQMPSRRQTVRADESEAGRDDFGAVGPADQGRSHPVRQYRLDFLDHQSRQHLSRQCGGRVRADRLLVRLPRARNRRA